MIFADQRPPDNVHVPIPVFTGAGTQGDGIVLKPGAATKIVCGTAADSGSGACQSFCPPVSLPDDYDVWKDGRDGCGRSWRPESFGVFLRRYSEWQKKVQARGGRMDYNEIIVDGATWNANLPWTVDAFFGRATHLKRARDQHRAFLLHYGLTERDVPLLAFDTSDWEAPFRAAAVQVV